MKYLNIMNDGTDEIYNLSSIEIVSKEQVLYNILETAGRIYNEALEEELTDREDDEDVDVVSCLLGYYIDEHAFLISDKDYGASGDFVAVYDMSQNELDELEQSFKRWNEIEKEIV